MTLKQLRVICAGYIVFLGLMGFLFVQLITWEFDIPSTLAGICGIFVGGLTGDRNFERGKNSLYVLANGIFCLIGVTLHAAYYYENYHSPGNYYPWLFVGPYIVAVIFLMQQFSLRLIGNYIGDDDT